MAKQRVIIINRIFAIRTGVFLHNGCYYGIVSRLFPNDLLFSIIYSKITFMKITLNGQKKELNSSSSLFELIQNFASDNQRIIAEVNGEIVQNPNWNDIQIKEGDSVELISFVGGG